jgi:hypothetical protein
VVTGVARARPSRATIYTRLDNALIELHDRLGCLPSPAESETIWSDIWHLEAHHSTALEGNTLVLREVEQLLGPGRAIGAKPLKEYMEVKGYSDAARWVYSQALEPDDWTTGGLVSMALRQAAQRGRLAAVQGPDGIWRSSRNAVNDYDKTKQKRRPPAR